MDSAIAPTGSTKTILVGDDESEVRGFLELSLRCQGYQVELADDGDEVLAHLRDRRPVDAVLLDIVMPSKDGIETLREIRRFDERLPVIMLSGLTTPLKIVEAMKSGASDFLPKPVTHEVLRLALKKALDKNSSIPAPASSQGGFEGMFYGSHLEMRKIRAEVRRIAESDCPVIVHGETGSGKEMLARDLHAQSHRAAMPFFKLNCAAVPAELMESELFGYERGAFTGAHQRKPGIFELADGGTLFLDEIGDMDMRLQAKLLQVLQDQQFRRLGGRETVRVEVRLIAATHWDLEQAMLNNTFRADLFYRLNVFTFCLPPLRKRIGDLPEIAGYLLRKHSRVESQMCLLTEELMRAFADYDWPGNIRELENVIRKLIVLQAPEAIIADLEGGRRRRALVTRRTAAEPEAIPAALLAHDQVLRRNAATETEAILAALSSARWNRKEAAAVLKIDYKALLYRMKKLGIGIRQPPSDDADRA